MTENKNRNCNINSKYLKKKKKTKSFVPTLPGNCAPHKFLLSSFGCVLNIIILQTKRKYKFDCQLNPDL